MTIPAADLGLKLDDHLPHRLSVASNGVSGLIARIHQQRFSLSAAQWRLICVLAEAGGLTPGQIVARTVMDKATVGRAARGLLNRGLARRSDRPVQARAHLLMLSEEGERLYAELAPLAQAYEAALTAGLKPHEVALLKRLLGRLQTAAEALAGEAEPPCRLAG